MTDDFKVYLALDVGDKRIGAAMTNSIARLPQPLTTLNVDENIMNQISDLIKANQVSELIIGLPRGLNGQETEQTKKIRKFNDEISSILNIPIFLIDEAGTSVQAKEELESRKKAYSKSDVDSLAASYILEDYLNEK
ncbi:MAG: Holliday junction resolvase RuvX [Candidatus Saccharibacteria bacterium]